MHSYFSLILVVLIVAAMAAMTIKKMRQKNQLPEQYEPRSDRIKANDFGDDCIIAVRKRERVSFVTNPPTPEVTSVSRTETTATPVVAKSQTKSTLRTSGASSLIVMYVMAKTGKQFAGYELLQSLLTAGMRFGDMNIFHRHQELNGSGSLIFSLASATEPGTFDIHNMGAFAGRGLTLFMQSSGDSAIDLERYDIMLKTAQQLAEDLDGLLLDEKRESLTKDKSMAKKAELVSSL